MTTPHRSRDRLPARVLAPRGRPPPRRRPAPARRAGRRRRLRHLVVHRPGVRRAARAGRARRDRRVRRLRGPDRPLLRPGARPDPLRHHHRGAGPARRRHGTTTTAITADPDTPVMTARATRSSCSTSPTSGPSCRPASPPPSSPCSAPTSARTSHRPSRDAERRARRPAARRSWSTAEQFTFLGRGWTLRPGPRGRAEDARGVPRRGPRRTRRWSTATARSASPAPAGSPGCSAPPPRARGRGPEHRRRLRRARTPTRWPSWSRAQRVAVARAHARGLDPDQPLHLTRSVILSSMSITLADARIVTPEGVHEGWLTIEDGRITHIGQGAAPRAGHGLGGPARRARLRRHPQPRRGGRLLPRPATRSGAARRRRCTPRHGTTTIMASLVTASLGRAGRAPRPPGRPVRRRPAGRHPLRRARTSPRPAAAPTTRRCCASPSPQEVAGLLKAGRGHVRMLTIAPELPGALDTIRDGRRRTA